MMAAPFGATRFASDKRPAVLTHPHFYCMLPGSAKQKGEDYVLAKILELSAS